ncbi:hypothetical protein [Nocardioides convexus]|nr:hypothetical protein [Nocardioides convexus]
MGGIPIATAVSQPGRHPGGVRAQEGQGVRHRQGSPRARPSAASGSC